MQHTHKLPKPSTEKISHSQQLEQKLAAQIKQQGPLCFADYMQAVLYDPEFGYYRAGLPTFGQAGDFVTAPEISPLFSQCVAKHFITIQGLIPQASILEFGAGSGRMAADILIYLQQQNAMPEQYLILEVSAALKQRQRQYLEQHCPSCLGRVIWLDTLPASDSFQGMMIANEVLDAMPVELFQQTADQIQQGYVNHHQDGFQMTWEAATPSLQKQVQALDIKSDHYQSEINTNIYGWITSLAETLHQGMILLLDYGYEQQSYYHPERNQGTLMCHLQHHAHSNPLIYPGIQDITAHVNFTAVAEAASDAQLNVLSFLEQGYFLLNQGITEMVDTKDTQKQIAQRQQIKQLTMPNQMGSSFKVMMLTKNLDNETFNYPSQFDRLHCL